MEKAPPVLAVLEHTRRRKLFTFFQSMIECIGLAFRGIRQRTRAGCAAGIVDACFFFTPGILIHRYGIACITGS